MTAGITLHRHSPTLVEVTVGDYTELVTRNDCAIARRRIESPTNSTGTARMRGLVVDESMVRAIEDEFVAVSA